MKDLIERVKSFSSPEDPKEKERIIKFLKETPSIKTIEEVLKHYKAELKQILEKDLLDWMQENDQVAFETEAFKIAIKTYVSAKMTNPDKGFAWLVAQDPENKNMFKEKLEFPKGELTNEAETALIDMGLSFVKKSGIAPPTLKKLIGDMLEAGDMMPEEEDGIKVGYFSACEVKDK